MEIESCGHKILIEDKYATDFGAEIPIRDRFWHIEPFEVVLDIGASLGSYTLPALAAGATVLAVDVLEQGPLISMATVNGWEGRLITRQCAVGSPEGGYPDKLMDAVRADQQTYPGFTDPALGWTTVDMLADWHHLDRVDWIKIDTEGAELPILEGAHAVLTRDHPRLLIEEHSHLPHIAVTGNAPKLRDLLAGYGYGIVETPYDNRALWYCE